jgi:hypothetical protein
VLGCAGLVYTVRRGCSRKTYLSFAGGCRQLCCCMTWSLSVVLKGAGQAQALAYQHPKSFTNWAKTAQIDSFRSQECTDVLIKSNAQAKHILAHSPNPVEDHHTQWHPCHRQGASNLCTSCTRPYLGPCCSSEGSTTGVRAHSQILANPPLPLLRVPYKIHPRFTPAPLQLTLAP